MNPPYKFVQCDERKIHTRRKYVKRRQRTFNELNVYSKDKTTQRHPVLQGSDASCSSSGNRDDHQQPSSESSRGSRTPRRSLKVNVSFQRRCISVDPLVSNEPCGFCRLQETTLALSKAPAHTPFSLADALRGEFHWKLNNGYLASHFNDFAYFRHLWPFQQLIGNSPALDDAVRCVCSLPDHPMSLIHPEQGALPHPPYIRALQSLQKCVDDRATAVRPETLASVVLLLLFETKTDNDGNGWVQHAKGLNRLLELKKPSQYTMDFELDLLDKNIPFIQLECMASGRYCFLASDIWDPILDKLAQPENKHRFTTSPAKIRANMTFARLPTVVKDFGRMVRLLAVTEASSRHENDDSFSATISILDSMMRDIYRRASNLRLVVGNWRNDYSPDFRIFDDANTEGQRNIIYKNGWNDEPVWVRRMLDCGLCTISILINHMQVWIREERTRRLKSLYDRVAGRKTQLAEITSTIKVSDLVDEALACAAASRQIFKAISLEKYALLQGLQKCNTTAWQAITSIEYRVTRSRSHSVLQAIGELWPMDLAAMENVDILPQTSGNFYSRRSFYKLGFRAVAPGYEASETPEPD